MMSGMGNSSRLDARLTSMMILARAAPAIADGFGDFHAFELEFATMDLARVVGVERV